MTRKQEELLCAAKQASSFLEQVSEPGRDGMARVLNDAIAAVEKEMKKPVKHSGQRNRHDIEKLVSRLEESHIGDMFMAMLDYIDTMQDNPEGAENPPLHWKVKRESQKYAQGFDNLEDAKKAARELSLDEPAAPALVYDSDDEVCCVYIVGKSYFQEE